MSRLAMRLSRTACLLAALLLSLPTAASAEIVEPAPSASWLGRAQQRIAEREYHATQSRAGLQAPNRRHALRTYFTPDGVRVVDREAAGAPELLSLSLESLGREAARIPVEPGVVTHDGSRVEIARPRQGIVEWFVNAPTGLEQGFTLASRPPGVGALTLEVAVGGAAVSTSGDGLAFRSDTGRRLHYDALHVEDSRGHVFPAHLVAGDSGFQIVVDDSGARYPLIVDPLLTATYDSEIQSNQVDAQLGSAVASAGDVNGDGYVDLIVGAPGFDSGELDEGAAFLFHGGASGLGDRDPIDADTLLQSNQAGASLGNSVASAGDVNGDGFDDVIVGAVDYDLGQFEEGVAFVFLGSASGVADGNPSTAHATFQANQPTAGLGRSVASAGDVDGDGFADVIVGAPRYDQGESNEGAAFIFYGSATGLSDGNPSTAGTVLEGNQAEARFGRSVASAGDVNGDGLMDVIVGANRYSAGSFEEGAAFVFHGDAGGISDGGPATADAQIEPDQADARLGGSVASAGDVNGDGYADVIVGARFFSLGQTEEGGAIVYLGSATGVVGGPPVNAHASFESNQAMAHMGASVASAGDVNGDGYADVVVGAPDYDDGESEEGAAFVYLGSSSGLTAGGPAQAWAQVQSDQADAHLGEAVAAADLDGDGFDDLIIGAPDFDGPQTGEGYAFVYHGGATGIEDGSPTTAKTLLESNQAEAWLGNSVASAGDVNGDGYADVIVGAPKYDSGEQDEGAAFIFLGTAGGIADGSPANVHALLESDQANAQLGRSVASAGDVNGDGYADVIVGAWFYDDGEADEGAAFIFLGSAAGLADGDPASAHAQLESNQVDARFGRPVASAGDVNGDGYADVLVGASGFDQGQTDEAAAFVFLGGPAGVSDGNPATAHARLQSNQASAADTISLSAASAGDVNGDGYADVVVGWGAFDFGGTNEGAAFVFLGGPAGLSDGDPVSAHARLQGNQDSASFGSSVATAGDVNGDGFDDLIVGAPDYDAGDFNEGAAFVFLGSATGIADAGAGSAHAQLESNEIGAALGRSVASAGDTNGDGFDDVVVGSTTYEDGGGAFVYLGSSSGIASGGPESASAHLGTNQVFVFLGQSVAGAGDVDGDGFGDVIVGGLYFDVGELDEGGAFIFPGSPDARLVRPMQRRGDGSGIPVQPGGLAYSSDSFVVEMIATSPRGRERARLEVEACPPGTPFDDPACSIHVSPTWVDLGTSGVTLSETISGLTPGELYDWRARILYAPSSVTEPGVTAAPRVGPWRRAQLGGAARGVRLLPEPAIALGLGAGCALLAIRGRRRSASSTCARR